MKIMHDSNPLAVNKGIRDRFNTENQRSNYVQVVFWIYIICKLGGMPFLFTIRWTKLEIWEQAMYISIYQLIFAGVELRMALPQLSRHTLSPRVFVKRVAIKLFNLTPFTLLSVPQRVHVFYYPRHAGYADIYLFIYVITIH